MIGVVLGAIFFYMNDIAGLTSVHFLYVAPILFIACTAILVIGSLMTAPPDEAKVKQYIWTKEFYDAETAELKSVPWYQNYRVLSIGLSILTAIIVAMFW